jgi:hypothetical protein
MSGPLSLAAPALLAAAPAVPSERVTPGIGGFLVFFVLGLASWLLYRSFAKHVRRVDVRSRLRAQEEAERRGDDELRRGPGSGEDEDDGGPPGVSRGPRDADDGGPGPR